MGKKSGGGLKPTWIWTGFALFYKRRANAPGCEAGTRKSRTPSLDHSVPSEIGNLILGVTKG